MGSKEDRMREIIKIKYESIPKMSKATGIPSTTIYHALDRGLDNTTTRVRTQLEDALFESDKDERDYLTADELKLITLYRSLPDYYRAVVLAVVRALAGEQ